LEITAGKLPACAGKLKVEAESSLQLQENLKTLPEIFRQLQNKLNCIIFIKQHYGRQSFSHNHCGIYREHKSCL
jgi:hypothetical protein